MIKKKTCYNLRQSQPTLVKNKNNKMQQQQLSPLLFSSRSLQRRKSRYSGNTAQVSTNHEDTPQQCLYEIELNKMKEHYQRKEQKLKDKLKCVTRSHEALQKEYEQLLQKFQELLSQQNLKDNRIELHTKMNAIINNNDMYDGHCKDSDSSIELIQKKPSSNSSQSITRISYEKINLNSQPINKHQQCHDDSFPLQSQKPQTRYYETGTRGKEKQKLPGHACYECQQFYNGIGAVNGNTSLHNHVSRHRSTFKKENTPEGFWGLDIPDLPTSQPFFSQI
ncbi:hypothetical protein RFI_14648 [Reticulomyxa filosa]|uniref:DNA endonuclease activator Ctp1 C-terminal domain-containing protein n=1 Tax=Reticulomyxa filosa TaxID=46433 RepID=X6N8D8_RETFI|nr:hypothetical protein RFI_14648 [Reticulomyxa filosa]|eukprot:ETO22545.1 hypothetical protein RFI_14648 [Reticulomyxa filosa]